MKVQVDGEEAFIRVVKQSSAVLHVVRMGLWGWGGEGGLVRVGLLEVMKKMMAILWSLEEKKYY